MSPDALLVLLALLLGLAFSQTRLCTVACVHALVVERRLDGVIRLVMAASVAAIMLLVCAWLWPDRIWLPHNPAVSWKIAAGGVLLGVGAMVNGGCYLGSITYLTTGNLNFIFTLVGIAAGVRLGNGSSNQLMPAEHGLRHAMGNVWLLAVGVFAFLLVLGFIKSRESRLVRYSTIATGALAGWIFAKQPDWSYGSVLDALAHADLHPVDWMQNWPALALFGGAICGALWSNRFQLRAPAFVRGLRCLAGGVLLGYGAALIPGGNDTLLLWAIPGLTAYGLAAFAVMAATIAIAVWLSSTRTYAARPR